MIFRAMNLIIDTMGLGFWCYHWFAPIFYIYEGVSLGKDTWFELMQKREWDYKNTLFMANIRAISLNCGSFADFVSGLPGNIVNNTYHFNVTHYSVYKGNSFGDRTIIRTFKNAVAPVGPYAAYRGSLAVALNFAYAMGYKTIILYGVDLKNSGYFWKDYKWVNPHTQTCHNQEENALHSTIASGQYRPIDEYIYFLRNAIFKKEDIEVYVGNKKSLLYPQLSYWGGNKND